MRKRPARRAGRCPGNALALRSQGRSRRDQRGCGNSSVVCGPVRIVVVYVTSRQRQCHDEGQTDRGGTLSLRISHVFVSSVRGWRIAIRLSHPLTHTSSVLTRSIPISGCPGGATLVLRLLLCSFPRPGISRLVVVFLSGLSPLVVGPLAVLTSMNWHHSSFRVLGVRIPDACQVKPFRFSMRSCG